jgi:hypothetical protein
VESLPVFQNDESVIDESDSLDNIIVRNPGKENDELDDFDISSTPEPQVRSAQTKGSDS